VIRQEQIEQLIDGVDRIAGAFERIAGALEKSNELTESSPKQMQQQMLEMFERLPPLLAQLSSGIAGGGVFPVTPWRSDAIVEAAFPPAPGDGPCKDCPPVIGDDPAVPRNS
jgi:hypothetical protein